MPRYELVFLDLDETLFDFRKAEAFALSAAFEQFGLDLDEAASQRYDEINRALWKRLEQKGIDQETLKSERFKQLFDALGRDQDPRSFSAAYLEHLGRGSFPFEGARELCEYLASRYRLVALTNGIGAVQRSRLARSPLAGYFERVIVSEDAGFSKPDPAIFEYACAQASFHRKEAMIMVGDSLSSDIRGGRDFGIDTCWVNLSGAERSGPAPTFEVRSLKAIEAIL